MNNELALEFIRGLYDTHIPTRYNRENGTWYYGSCDGEHYVSGWEFELDTDGDGLCPLHKRAADILGLPYMMIEKSPPAPPLSPEEQEKFDKDPLNIAMKAYMKHLVKSFSLMYDLKKPIIGESVTFQIKE